MSSTGNFVQSEFRYDEGKSPLALLAETCRNIGVDTSTIKLTKSSIDHTKSSSSSSSTSLESRKSNDSCRLSVSPIRNGSASIEKQSTPNSITSSTTATTPTPTTSTSTTSTTPTSRTSANSVTLNSNSTSSKDNANFLGITTNVTSRESSKCSFKPYEDHVTSKRICSEESKRRSATPTSSLRSLNNSDKDNNNSSSNNNNNNNASNNNGNVRKSSESPRHKREHLTGNSPSTGNNSSRTFTPSNNNGLDELSKKHNNCSNAISSSSSSSSSSTTTSTSKGSNCNGCLPHPTSSAAHQLSVDSVSKFVPYPSISPYLGLPGSYEAALAAATAARLGAPGQNGAQSHCHSPSMCRNPFCPGCRFAAAAAAAANNLSGSVPGSCPAGCTQCSHTSSIASSMGLAAALQNSYLSAANNQGVHAFYQQQAAAAAASVGLGKPNICSWMVGNTFCGKRFASSEELVQHLRNHTSSDPSSLSALAFLGQYPHLNPMLASPGLRQTSFGPSQSALAAATAAAAAANRYHPYKSFSGNSPLTNLPSGLSSLPTLTSPGSASSPLNMHYPSYGPYPGRMGPPIPP